MGHALWWCVLYREYKYFNEIRVINPGLQIPTQPGAVGPQLDPEAPADNPAAEHNNLLAGELPSVIALHGLFPQ